ncbi:hypothetical protein GCM10027202_34210 [Microvirgula curvata]
MLRLFDDAQYFGKQELPSPENVPDLSLWALVEVLTVEQAAMLIGGIDPSEFRLIELAQGSVHTAMYKRAVVARQALCGAISLGTLPSLEVWQQSWSGDQYVIGAKQSASPADIVAERTTIQTSALLSWLARKQFRTIKQDVKEAIASAFRKGWQQGETQQKNGEVSEAQPMAILPKRTYTTPPLDVIEEVIAEHWEGYDPSDPNAKAPKQHVITQAIYRKLEERGVANPSATMVDYMDRIARHPNAKSGGNKKLKG